MLPDKIQQTSCNAESVKGPGMQQIAELTRVEAFHYDVQTSRRGGEQWMRIQERHFNSTDMLKELNASKAGRSHRKIRLTTLLWRFGIHKAFTSSRSSCNS
jgi:hypothetical protein